jgi:hypothetical protein
MLELFTNDAVKLAGHSTASYIMQALIKAVAKFINEPESEFVIPFKALLQVLVIVWHLIES